MKKNKIEKFFKIITFLLLTYASIMLVIWFLEAHNTTNIATEINKISEITTNEKTDTISVNFDNLTSTNPDTIGWLSISNTNISYPIVQSTDNSYYLTHNYYKENNSAGWLFADYRNNFDNLNQNTIIYGHNRIEKTMFGTLHNLLDESWYTKDQTIYFNTLNKKMRFQVFSVYSIKAEDYIPTTTFTEEELDTFINNALSNSIYDFNVEIDKNDTFLTLYTCANGNKNRIIVHTKLLYQED